MGQEGEEKGIKDNFDFELGAPDAMAKKEEVEKGGPSLSQGLGVTN